jgi:hypothetical protein
MDHLVDHILGPSPFPTSTSSLFKPRRNIPLSAGILGYWHTPINFNPTLLRQYRLWLQDIGRLRGVCRPLYYALTRAFFRSLWIRHPYQMKILLEFFSAASFHLPLNVSWVQHLRLDLGSYVTAWWDENEAIALGLPANPWDSWSNQPQESYPMLVSPRFIACTDNSPPFLGCT